MFMTNYITNSCRVYAFSHSVLQYFSLFFFAKVKNRLCWVAWRNLWFFISSYSADFKDPAPLYLRLDVSQPVLKEITFSMFSLPLSNISHRLYLANLTVKLDSVPLLTELYLQCFTTLKIYSHRSPNLILPFFFPLICSISWRMAGVRFGK